MYRPLIITHGKVDSPAAGDVRIYVFTRGTDGNLWLRVWDGTGWYWSNFGKRITSDPVALVRGDTGSVDFHKIRINIFVVGADGKLWELIFNGVSWGWSDTGRAVAFDAQPLILAQGNLASTSAEDVRISLFVRGADGNLWLRSWSGTAWYWSNFGMQIIGDPVAHVRGDTSTLETRGNKIRVNMFVTGADGKLMESDWNGTAWNASDTRPPRTGVEQELATETAPPGIGTEPGIEGV